jgi:NodT family efflux transporter outer membrane factor (OMF) lipoprotein
MKLVNKEILMLTRIQQRISRRENLGAIALGFFFLFMLSSCSALGPDYTQPSVPLGGNWLEIDAPALTNESAAPQWWHSAFLDPDLDRLIEEALQENLTVRSAGLRVLQAQQQLAIAIGNQYPQQQQVTGSASRQKESGITFSNYNVGFNVSWEVDFWGRFKRQVESASAELDASVANYDGAVVTLISQIAENYILFRTFTDRLKVANYNIKLQESSLNIARVKFNAGEVSKLDVDQAESLLNNTKATVYSLEISLQQAKNALAVLLGKPPQDFNYLFDKQKGIPDVNPTIALGIPQDLIRQRPDIRFSERQLAAQSARIGFAESELYPHFAIGGSIGTSAFNTNDLFKNDSQVWSLAGIFEWNIFNYGRLKSNVRLQDALFQQLLVDYMDVVLQAQGDVENSIIAYLKTHQQLVSYQLAAEASQRAVDASEIQYLQGEIPFNTLLTTLGTNVQQQDLVAATRGNTSINLVQIYRALGGGWQIRQDRDPVELLPVEIKEEMRKRTGAWNGILK